jgi:hypothetical protein
VFAAELIRKGVVELWGHDGFDGLSFGSGVVKDRVSDRFYIGDPGEDLAKTISTTFQPRREHSINGAPQQGDFAYFASGEVVLSMTLPRLLLKVVS